MFEAQVAQKAQWPIWESIRLIILGPGFNSCQSFGQWLKVLTNLTNLTNLLSHNLGKTELFYYDQGFLVSFSQGTDPQGPYFVLPPTAVPLNRVEDG